MAKIFFRPRALSVLEKFLSRKEQEKVNSLLDQLAKGYFPPNTKKLRDVKNGYRIRVGRWRVLFSLETQKNKIEIIDIFLEKGDQDYRRRQKLF